MLAFVEHRYPALWPWIQLMRLDRPIGSMLLMWPTLWALWIAGDGTPGLKHIIIFVLGVFVMRAAGCVINDFADRDFDGHVTLTLVLSFGGLGLAVLYPFTKRFTYLPQLFLGAAFSWAIPMAFAAETESVPEIAWLLFTTNLLWTVAYDTEYAMCDREDDLKVGIKSTAILFGDLDKVMVGAAGADPGGAVGARPAAGLHLALVSGPGRHGGGLCPSAVAHPLPRTLALLPRLPEQPLGRRQCVRGALFPVSGGRPRPVTPFGGIADATGNVQSCHHHVIKRQCNRGT